MRSPASSGISQPVVDRVGGAGRNQADVRHRARRPRVALVDRIAMLVELQAAVEVRARLDRTLAAVLDARRCAAAPGRCRPPPPARPTRRTRRRCRRERSARPSGCARRPRAGPTRRAARPRPPCRAAPTHFGGGLTNGMRRAKIQRLLADGERARQALIARRRAPTAALAGGGASAHETEDVDRICPSRRKSCTAFSCICVAVDERQRRVRGGKAVRAHLPFLAAGSFDGTQRHVAVGALAAASAGSRTTARPRPTRRTPANCRSR